MDKLLDKLNKEIEKSGMRGRQVIATGSLEGVAGDDGHGPRDGGKLSSPKSVEPKPSSRKGSKSAY